jgi:hypothetical protein
VRDVLLSLLPHGILHEEKRKQCRSQWGGIPSYSPLSSLSRYLSQSYERGTDDGRTLRCGSHRFSENGDLGCVRWYDGMQGRAGGSKKRSSPVETTITAAIITGALSMRMIVMVTATPSLFRSRLRRGNCALYCVVSMSCRYVLFLVARLQPDSTAKYTPALHDGHQYLDFRSLNAPI